MPRTYRSRSQRRAEILDATEALMAELGIQAVTMARIAENVGLTPGALYRHFRSRADIVAAIVHRDIEELAAVEASDLRRYLAAEAERYLTDPAYARVRRELVYLAAFDPAFAAQASAYEHELVARVGAEHALEMRAAQLVLDGLSMRADRSGGFDPRTEEAVRHVFELLVDASGAGADDPSQHASDRARRTDGDHPAATGPKEPT